MAEPMSTRAASVLRRYGLVGYWAVFAVWTLRAGEQPGLTPPGVVISYPWWGVEWTWIILAVDVSILYAILRPRTFQGSLWRLSAALLFAFCLASWEVMSVATDMPGFAYMPAIFSLITATILTMWIVATAAFRWVGGRRSRA